jgi:Tol biopolymer transport system component
VNSGRSPLIVCVVVSLGSHSRSFSREILYGAQQPGNPESIWALNPSTGLSRLVLRGDSVSSRQQPQWAPDGRAIAYVRELEGRVELYIRDSAKAAPRELAPGLAGYRYFPDWSPDGQRLLFTGGTSPDEMSVYSVNRDGTGLRLVLPDSASYRCPSWAPDGNRFVVSSRMRSGKSSLVLVELATKARSTLLESDSTLLDCPRWAPHSDDILFTLVHHCSGGWNNCNLQDIDSDLAILDLSTRRVALVTRDRNMSNYGAWSRSGQWIVFQSDRHAPPGWGRNDTLAFAHRFDSLELYIVKPNGESLRRVTSNKTFDSHPSW